MINYRFFYWWKLIILNCAFSVKVICRFMLYRQWRKGWKIHTIQDKKTTIFFLLPLRFIGYLSASEIRLIKMVAAYNTVYSPLYTPILVLCWLLLLLILRDDKLVFLTLGLNWGLLSLSSSTVIPTIDVEDNPP